ncbi:MAG: PsiF family protein [Alphaproteobacteria bacterium]
MKPALLLAVIVPNLILATAVQATPWQADPHATWVSDRRIQECADTADAKKLKGFEREKFIKSCAKGSN